MTFDILNGWMSKSESVSDSLKAWDARASKNKTCSTASSPFQTGFHEPQIPVRQTPILNPSTLHTAEVTPLRVNFGWNSFSLHIWVLWSCRFLWGPRRCVCSMSRQDFGQIFFLNIFLGAFKTHYLVSWVALPSHGSSEKVNWRYSKFVTTSRKQIFAEMRGFGENHCQSL